MKELVTILIPAPVMALERRAGAARRAAAAYAWREGVDIYERSCIEYLYPSGDLQVTGPVRDLFSNEDK